MSRFPERQYYPLQEGWHQQEAGPAAAWHPNSEQSEELAYIDWNAAFDAVQHGAGHPELSTTSEQTSLQDAGFNSIAYEAQSSNDRLPDIFQQDFTFDQHEAQPEEPCSSQPLGNVQTAENGKLLERIMVLEARVHEQENRIVALSESSGRLRQYIVDLGPFLQEMRGLIKGALSVENPKLEIRSPTFPPASESTIKPVSKGT